MFVFKGQVFPFLLQFNLYPGKKCRVPLEDFFFLHTPDLLVKLSQEFRIFRKLLLKMWNIKYEFSEETEAARPGPQSERIRIPLLIPRLEI